jgi:hypothetical protein
MRNLILEIISSALLNRADYFLREQDIQLYLANYFINSNEFDNVFIEYHVPSNIIFNYPWSDVNNIYVDVVLEKNGLFYPIEIKYKTRTQNLPYLVFGQGVNVALGQQGAQNIGCYDFWKDVKRIEMFEQTFQNVERGVVLFVSNDISYQNSPLNPNVGYAPFSIHQGRTIPINTFLDWNGNLAVGNVRPGLIVNYPYNINWTPMIIPNHSFILV